MSSSYLDKFRSSLPTVQGNQILKILTYKRDSGEIRSVDEFKDNLRKLTQEILAERITPTLKIFNAIAGADTSSAQYNEMLDRIEDDLESIFAEADNIDEIIEGHHNLINNIALKALRYGINELESKIILYEFLNKNSKGFDDALFNTFRESAILNTSRSDNAASLVFVDPRKKEVISADEDAQVDLIGERLIIGADKEEYLTIRDAAWLSNSNSIRSELNVAFKNSRISNIIDSRNNTYWIAPILLSDISSTGVPLEVCLYMSAFQDVNFIEIEPASNFPMILTGIDYYDANNNCQSSSATSITVDKPTRINFERVTANSIILKFRQDNYREIQFTNKLGESNLVRAILKESTDTVDMDSINEDLKELLTSDFILTDIMNVKDSNTDQSKYFEYLIGFDNIRVGFSTFDERSIFVSSKKKVVKPGQLALRVNEVRPIQVEGSSSITLEEYTYPAKSTAESQKFHHGSIEYWGILQFYSKDNYLISTDTIPLLPLSAQRVHHEQMVFTATTTNADNPDAAQLMFYTEDDSSDVIVYKNKTALTYSDDWDFVDSGESDVGHLTITTSNAGNPMKRGIRIISTVLPLNIYTVSYTPVVSNTHTLPSDTTLFDTVDLIGDESIRMVAQNAVVL